MGTRGPAANTLWTHGFLCAFALSLKDSGGVEKQGFAANRAFVFGNSGVSGEVLELLEKGLGCSLA
jgi:hypothetical protein